MPNFDKHLKTGALIGSIATAALNIINQLNRIDKDEQEKFDIGELFLKSALGAGVGAISGVLPDILEPAVSPHHRSFFHSKAFATLLTIGSTKFLKSGTLSENEKEMLVAFSAGFGSHLALDSKTPMGLPVINSKF